MIGYRFAASCLACGEPLRHVADGRPTGTGTRTTAVARCTGCNLEHVVIVTVVPGDHRQRLTEARRNGLGRTPAARRKGVPA